MNFLSKHGVLLNLLASTYRYLAISRANLAICSFDIQRRTLVHSLACSFLLSLLFESRNFSFLVLEALAVWSASGCGRILIFPTWWSLFLGSWYLCYLLLLLLFWSRWWSINSFFLIIVFTFLLWFCRPWTFRFFLLITYGSKWHRLRLQQMLFLLFNRGDFRVLLLGRRSL